MPYTPDNWQLEIDWDRAKFYYGVLDVLTIIEQCRDLYPLVTYPINGLSLMDGGRVLMPAVGDHLLSLYEDDEHTFCTRIVEIYNTLGGDGTYFKEIDDMDKEWFAWGKRTERDFEKTHTLRPEKFKFTKRVHPQLDAETLLVCNYDFSNSETVRYFEILLSDMEIIDCGAISDFEQTLLIDVRPSTI